MIPAGEEHQWRPVAEIAQCMRRGMTETGTGGGERLTAPDAFDRTSVQQA